ncbi:sugar-binding domain-containing protein [Chitinophaga lutea]
MLRAILSGLCYCLLVTNAYAQNTDLAKKIASAKLKTNPLVTGAGKAWGEYPRPTMARKNWINLNGPWNYRIVDSNAAISSAAYDGKIQVPFPVESQLSGVQKPLLPHQRLVYQKQVKLPHLTNGDHYLLHFGAVDWEAEVFVNGKSAGKHQGGYEPFSFDITGYLQNGGEASIMVAVKDPTDKGINPHGKQTLNPGNIYYTPTSGIWQTVWMERVPGSYIEDIRISPDIDNGLLHIDAMVAGRSQGAQLRVTVLENHKVVAGGNGAAQERVSVKIPNAKLWSPENPFLYDVRLELVENGRVTDEVSSYAGMRKISVGKDQNGYPRIQLNNSTVFNLGVLDQGFWPDGLYTAPSAAALRFDIAAIKAMGFNTIRKHIKVEPELWYYYADKLGILVWQDFVNPPHGLMAGAKPQFEKELKSTIAQLRNHPSIISWVVFNEGWGAFDQERITRMVKDVDPTRLVNGHSGQLLYVNNNLRKDYDLPWAASDIADIHTYPFPRGIKNAFGKVAAIGEFGGVAVNVPYHNWNDVENWGYDTQRPDRFRRIYRRMIDSVAQLEKAGLSAAIYTQPFDVETEANGFMSYDRSVLKIPFDTMQAINGVLTASRGSNSSIAKAVKLIDEQDTDEKYDEYLKAIRAGGSDSALLRRIILLSMKKKDTVATHDLLNIFLKKIKDPLNYDNAMLLTYAVSNPDVPGYTVLISDSIATANAIGQGRYKAWKRNIIMNKYIKPRLRAQENIDWEKIADEVTAKYGEPTREYVLGAAMEQNLRSKDWVEFGKYYKGYFELAMDHSEYNINFMTWYLFLNISDPSLLKYARDVAKYNIQFKDDSPDALDTYANILYKLGEKEEAIALQKKAVAAKPEMKEMAENLDKMQRGLPTWIVNTTTGK